MSAHSPGPVRAETGEEEFTGPHGKAAELPTGPHAAQANEVIEGSANSVRLTRPPMGARDRVWPTSLVLSVAP
ncbi:hypothetical protein OPV22_008591 [Ensete ventricosum]|uniref:SMP domain-containing protein n=1 Tax=Ensete ventricosum TaxID=4639 RepID=A0AAV8PQ32_ENSVE|nr:hypothetical protein OPV22_008591 [Ensete ventricosum]